jgi:hypothetical protein
MAILFACNAASAVVGIGQFYRPERFNPPVMRAGGGLTIEDYTYETADGRKVVRPCGLTDTPGGACAAGMLAGLLGLGWSLQPIAAWRRLAALGLAFAGLMVIYLSQVRAALVMEVISLLTLAAALAARRDVRRLRCWASAAPSSWAAPWPGWPAPRGTRSCGGSGPWSRATSAGPTTPAAATSCRRPSPAWSGTGRWGPAWAGAARPTSTSATGRPARPRRDVGRDPVDDVGHRGRDPPDRPLRHGRGAGPGRPGTHHPDVPRPHPGLLGGGGPGPRRQHRRDDLQLHPVRLDDRPSVLDHGRRAARRRSAGGGGRGAGGG